MDPVFTRIASEMGLKQNMYPFGKVTAGLDSAKAAHQMPDMVIYHHGKAKFRYKDEAEGFKMVDWLNNCLTEVSLPIFKDEILTIFSWTCRSLRNI